MNPRHALAETTNAFPGKDNRGYDTVRVPHRKGTCLVVTVAPRRPRIEFRADDPTLTPNGGLALVAETCRVLDVIGIIERHVGPIKARRRPPTWDAPASGLVRAGMPVGVGNTAAGVSTDPWLSSVPGCAAGRELPTRLFLGTCSAPSFPMQARAMTARGGADAAGVGAGGLVTD